MSEPKQQVERSEYAVKETHVSEAKRHPLERLDDLIIGGMKLWQRTDQFRFSIDAVILSHFVTIKQGWRYGDLGTGTGVIPLVLSGLGAQYITGFELNPITADLAKRNVVLNQKQESIHIVEGDYCKLPMAEYNGRFDGLAVNPPYFESNTGAVPVSEGIQVALHEAHTTIEDVCTAASQLLKFRGRLWMIYRAERLADALQALRSRQLEPKRLRFVHSMPGKGAKLVLIEAVKGGRSGMDVEAPLYIYKRPDQYSEEVLTWYGK